MKNGEKSENFSQNPVHVQKMLESWGRGMCCGRCSEFIRNFKSVSIIIFSVSVHVKIPTPTINQEQKTVEYSLCLNVCIFNAKN